MTYDERKEQLNSATLQYVKKNGYIVFEEDNEPVLNLVFCGEPREERLMEVYNDTSCLDEGIEFIVVHTFADEADEYTDFTDFSNDEMTQIMKVCGIPVPEEV